MARRRRTLTKADIRPAQAEATFTPAEAIAIAQALVSRAPVNGVVTPLPRGQGLGALPFSPGVPLIPSAINPPRPDSGRPEPRAYEYPITANLPGSNEKLVPWSVLRQAADGVSMFRKCIEIRKNEVSTLEWDIVISKKAIAREARSSGSPSRAEVQQAMQAKLEPDIGRLIDFWEEPDRRNGLDWIAWAKKALEERFVLDALAIYPRHTYSGDLYSLEIVDGSTVKPLLDEFGGRPLPPSAAYQQVLYGFPRGEFIADLGEDGLPKDCYPSDQLIYEIDNVRSWTPYGYSATERALIDGALFVQRNAWMLAEYTDGVMPSGWLVAGEGQADWSADQLREYEQLLNDYYSGITGNRQRLRILPYGMQPHDSPNQAEKYKPEYDLHLIKLVAGHFDTTLAELGFTEQGGLGSTGWHEGQAAVQDRKATAPTVAALQDLVTRISRRHLHMPRELEFKIVGLETDDEQAADLMGSAQYANGRKTLNEERDRLGQARYSFPEADKPFIVGGTGLIFIEGAIEQQKAAQEQAAAVADAKANPPAPGDGESGPGGKPKPGSPDKPAGGGGNLAKVDEPDLDKTEQADLVKAEVQAYARWERKNPTPKRPFRVQHASPADFTDPDPGRVEFDEWVWESDLDKADWTDSLHPRDSKGRFRKKTLGELVRHVEGLHGTDRAGWPPHHRRNVAKREAAGETIDVPKPPSREQAARDRQTRIDRAAAVADVVAAVERAHHSSDGDPDVVATKAKDAARAVVGDQAEMTHATDLADLIDDQGGDAAEMLAIARQSAAKAGLKRITGAPGEREPFDPSKHETIGGSVRPGAQVEILRPAYEYDPGDGPVRLAKAQVDEPFDGPAAAPQPVKPGQESARLRARRASRQPKPDTATRERLGREMHTTDSSRWSPETQAEADRLAAAGAALQPAIGHDEVVEARMDLEHADRLEAQAAGALDPDYDEPPRDFSDEEVLAHAVRRRERAAEPIEGTPESAEEQMLREGREATAGNALIARRDRDPSFLAGNPEADRIAAQAGARRERGRAAVRRMNAEGVPPEPDGVVEGEVVDAPVVPAPAAIEAGKAKHAARAEERRAARAAKAAPAEAAPEFPDEPRVAVRADRIKALREQIHQLAAVNLTNDRTQWPPSERAAGLAADREIAALERPRPQVSPERQAAAEKEIRDALADPSLRGRIDDGIRGPDSPWIDAFTLRERLDERGFTRDEQDAAMRALGRVGASDVIASPRQDVSLGRDREAAFMGGAGVEKWDQFSLRQPEAPPPPDPTPEQLRTRLAVAEQRLRIDTEAGAGEELLANHRAAIADLRTRIGAADATAPAPSAKEKRAAAAAARRAAFQTQMDEAAARPPTPAEGAALAGREAIFGTTESPFTSSTGKPSRRTAAAKTPARTRADQIRQTLHRGEQMHGSDRSKWAVRERRDAEKLERELAQLEANPSGLERLMGGKWVDRGGKPAKIAPASTPTVREPKPRAKRTKPGEGVTTEGLERLMGGRWTDPGLAPGQDRASRLRALLQAAERMHGSDRSKWTVRERRDAERLEAELAGLTASAPVKPSTRTPQEHETALAAMTSRDEAKAYVAAVRGKELDALMRHLNLGTTGTAEAKRQRVTQALVGSRLDSDAILRNSSAGKTGGAPNARPVLSRSGHRTIGGDALDGMIDTLRRYEDGSSARTYLLDFTTPEKRVEIARRLGIDNPDNWDDPELIQQIMATTRQKQKAIPSPDAQAAAEAKQAAQRAAGRARTARNREQGAADVAALTSQYDDLLSQAEALDTDINFAENDQERARLEAQREAIDVQMQAIDRQIPAARKRGIGKADSPDPKVPRPPDTRWPAWTVDEQLAAAYTREIQQATAGGLTTTATAQELATAWLAATAANPDLGSATWLEARGWNVTRALVDVLNRLHTEAYLIGVRSAAAVMEAPDPRISLDVDVDWGAWKPGDVDAARLILSADGKTAGLQKLLDRFGITIKSIAAHRLDELAAVLSDGLERGLSPDEIARAIRGLVEDPAKAYRIAVTETARALSAAALAEYEADGIATKGWMNAADQDVCQLCKDNEDAGDIPIGDPFPSGEPFPPAHPLCRCSIIPGLDVEGAA